MNGWGVETIAISEMANRGRLFVAWVILGWHLEHPGEDENLEHETGIDV
jgi:hypothetical protein